jgi:hypothetical protein
MVSSKLQTSLEAGPTLDEIVASNIQSSFDLNASSGTGSDENSNIQLDDDAVVVETVVDPHVETLPSQIGGMITFCLSLFRQHLSYQESLGVPLFLLVSEKGGDGGGNTRCNHKAKDRNSRQSDK